MNAHEESFLISAYIDGELSPEERSRVDAHLPHCAACRFDLESLKHTKASLAATPRRAMPPELVAAIEARSRAPWSLPSWRSPWVWASAFAAAVVALWVGVSSREPDQYVPLEPLLAAHSRYTAESLVPQGTLVASNYTSPLTPGNEGDEQEAE